VGHSQQTAAALLTCYVVVAQEVISARWPWPHGEMKRRREKTVLGLHGQGV
jgi:hypothetical protein